MVKYGFLEYVPNQSISLMQCKQNIQNLSKSLSQFLHQHKKATTTVRGEENNSMSGLSPKNKCTRVATNLFVRDNNRILVIR